MRWDLDERRPPGDVILDDDAPSHGEVCDGCPGCRPKAGEVSLPDLLGILPPPDGSPPGVVGYLPPGVSCRYCGHPRVRVEERLEAAPLGTYSIAGVQTKVVARRWPFAVCEGCGHESRGERV